MESSSDQVVIFSTTQLCIERTCKFLNSLAYDSRYIHGGVSTEDRKNILDDFDNGKFRVLVISFGVGGVSLNLSSASIGIFMDLPWTPMVLQQAQDRLHRIGQKRNVQIIKLQSVGTIDERIEDLLVHRLQYEEEIFRSLSFVDLKRLVRGDKHHENN